MAQKESHLGKSSAERDKNDEVSGQHLQCCQPCSNNGKKNVAAVFCLTCNEFQCKECSNGHNIYTFMKHHKLVDANAARDVSVMYDIAGLDRCEKHNKLVKFFCKDHEKLCCSTCAIIEHRKCDHVEEIKNMGVKESNRDLSFKVEISKLKERCTAAVKHWADGETLMNEQMQNLIGRITAVRTSVNTKLDELEGDIKQQTTSLSGMKATEYSNNRSNCEETVNTLERDLEILDAVKRKGTPEQQFVAQQRVKESLVRTREKASQELSKLESIEISLELSRTLEHLLDSTEKLGSLKTNISKVSIDAIVEGRPVALKKIMSIDVQQSEDDTDEPYFTGMDFLPDGRLVVVDNANMKCFIFSERLEELGSCKLSSNPLGIAAVSGDEVAVTSGWKIYFLRVSQSNEITQIRTVTTTSKDDSICMRDNEHFVVGTYGDIKPVRIISFSGEEEDFNIDFRAKKYDLDISACTYIKNSDKVVLTDRDEHTVYIFFVKTTACLTVKDDQIKAPRGVSIGPFDSIFVCSRGTNSIVQVSQTGQILSSHKLDMKFPYRVCVSKDKTKLAVSNNAIGGRKLQLLSLDICS